MKTLESLNDVAQCLRHSCADGAINPGLRTPFSIDRSMESLSHYLHDADKALSGVHRNVMATTRRFQLTSNETMKHV
jgi:hypothetical protein